MSTMKPLLTSEEMRAVDARAINVLGIPADQLMNNAALRVFDAIKIRFPEMPPAMIVCGPGNNGGDGIALATYMHRAGWPVICRLFARENPKPPCDVFWALAGRLGVDAKRIEPKPGVALRKAAIQIANWRGGLIVDALFGTGLARKLSPEYAMLIEAINLRKRDGDTCVVAIDAPSGLCTTTGHLMGNSDLDDSTCAFGHSRPSATESREIHSLQGAVAASLTCTIGHLKQGFFNWNTAELCGELEVLDIGFPFDSANAARSWLLEIEDVRELLPKRGTGSHKGAFGKILVVAGGKGMAGAAALAAKGALRAGAGMVKLAVPAQIARSIKPGPEVMMEEIEESKGGFFTADCTARVLKLSKWADVIAIGCGVGRAPDTMEFVRRVVFESGKPAVVDADGIYAFADARKCSRVCAAAITPHPGEFAAVSGLTREEIETDPFTAVRAFARERGFAVAFKCGRSFACHPDGTIFVSPTGNPGMATAGSGDVLTGIIAGTLGPMAVAAKDAPAKEITGAVFMASAIGQFIHGMAGDLAALGYGEDSLVADDIIEFLPDALLEIRAGSDFSLGARLIRDYKREDEKRMRKAIDAARKEGRRYAERRRKNPEMQKMSEKNEGAAI
ncbi:MAG: NAD(P)H-hydrate dehydratase [bacterium]|jgi:NAD(P)H-hydrate epimerase